MRVSREFGFTVIGIFLVSVILAYFELLLIDEITIFRLQSYFFAFWNPLINFLSGYPIYVAILISLTLITFYILKFFGIRIR